MAIQQTASAADPHGAGPILTYGPAPETAPGTMVMIHGRGATAESILSLYPELGVDHLAAVAPQAAGYTWYPYSFLAPTEANQPYLDSALRRIERVVSELLGRGVVSERIALVGFSQGACLLTEFVARNPKRYGAVIAFSGGLIGPPGTARNDGGSLNGTPVFLGCSERDPHVPFERVEETERVFTKMGGKVDIRKYPGSTHTINEDELEAAKALLHPLNTR